MKATVKITKTFDKWSELAHSRTDKFGFYYCSVCGCNAILYKTDVIGMPYCPNCGARMKETNND